MREGPTLPYQAFSYRERAALEAYRRCRQAGKPEYEAWEAALGAYGEDSAPVRQRLNLLLLPFSEGV